MKYHFKNHNIKVLLQVIVKPKSCYKSSGACANNGNSFFTHIISDLQEYNDLLHMCNHSNFHSMDLYKKDKVMAASRYRQSYIVGCITRMAICDDSGT
jgi:hypothetical protein